MLLSGLLLVIIHVLLAMNKKAKSSYHVQMGFEIIKK